MAGKYVNTAKGRRWQNADGTYAYEKPGGGRQFGAELIEFLAPGTNQRTAELRQNPRPSQPDGEPTVYAQHAGTEYRQTTDGRDVYVTNGVSYDRATGQQVARPHGSDETGIHDGAFSYTPEDKYDAYKGTSIRNQDNQSIYEGTQVWKVPDHTGGNGGGNGGGNNSGRNDSRVSPTGVAQKGTNMSRSFNDLLATTNTSGYQPFGSNQLPTTAGSPDSGITPKTQAILAGIQAGKKTDMSIEGYQEPTTSRTAAQNGVLAGIQAGQQTDRGIDGYKGQNYTTIQPDDPQFAAAFGQDLADKYQKEGGSKVTGYTKGGRLDQALSDTAGINSYMSKFSSGDQERLANRAFLDTEDSMLALRAKEAVNGVVYAGGKHYVPGESADSPAVEIKRSDARDISNNKAKAEQFKSKKVADTIAATKQEPPTLESAASSQAFKQDKPISATMPGDIGGKTEYYSNNDNVIEPFGGPKGYSSGFKRIDTSMNNPFG